MILLLGGGCAAPGASFFAAHPELGPGKTTWAALSRAAEASGTPTRPRRALQGLRDLVDQALEHNPRIRAAREAWTSRIEAVGPAGTPPRPQLAYTYLPLPVETRVGPNEHRIAIQQKIPSPLRLVAQRDAAVHDAGIGRSEYDARVLEVLTELKSRAAELRYLQQAARLVSTHEELARQLATAAAGRSGEDRGTLFDVSKARSQLAQLGYDRIRFAELRDAARARINQLLGRTPGGQLPELPAWPPAAVPATPEALYDRALRTQPTLRAWDGRLRKAVDEVREARGRAFPALTLGVQLLVNGAPSTAGTRDAGRDAVGLTIGVDLPLWFVADRAAERAAEARLRRAGHEKRSFVLGLLADLDDGLYRLRNARRLVTLYDGTLLPQARQALSDSEAWQRSGVGGFTDYLEARATLYRFTLARERAAADASQAEAQLERLVGAPLGEEVRP